MRPQIRYEPFHPPRRQLHEDEIDARREDLDIVQSGQRGRQSLLLLFDERTRLLLVGRVGECRHARGLREYVDVPDVFGRLHRLQERGAADAEAEPQAGHGEELRQRAHEEEIRQPFLAHGKARLVLAEVEEGLVDDELCAGRQQLFREVCDGLALHERARRVVGVAEHDAVGLHALRLLGEEDEVWLEARPLLERAVRHGSTGGMRRPLVLTEGGHGQEDTLRPRDEGVEVEELRRTVAEDEVPRGSVVVGSK